MNYSKIKKIIRITTSILILVLSLTMIELFSPTPASAAISRGKTGNNSERDSAPLVISWSGGGSSAAGSAILVYIFDTHDFNRTFSVTDSASNSYTLDNTWHHPGGGPRIRAYSALNTSAASSVTVTPSGYETFAVAIVEISGLATSNAVDKKVTIHDNDYEGGSSWTGNATGVLSQADELIVVLNDDAYGGGLSAYSATGYTQEYFSDGDAVLDKIVSSTGSVTPSGTATVTSNYWIGTAVITYKAAAEAPAASNNVHVGIRGDASTDNIKIRGGATTGSVKFR